MLERTDLLLHLRPEVSFSQFQIVSRRIFPKISPFGPASAAFALPSIARRSLGDTPPTQLDALEQAVRTGMAPLDQIEDWIHKGWIKQDEAFATFRGYRTSAEVHSGAGH